MESNLVSPVLEGSQVIMEKDQQVNPFYIFLSNEMVQVLSKLEPHVR